MTGPTREAVPEHFACPTHGNTLPIRDGTPAMVIGCCPLGVYHPLEVLALTVPVAGAGEPTADYALDLAEGAVRSLHHYGCPPDARLKNDVDGDVQNVTELYRAALSAPRPVGGTGEDIALVQRELDTMAHTNAYGPLKDALTRILAALQGQSHG